MIRWLTKLLYPLARKIVVRKITDDAFYKEHVVDSEVAMIERVVAQELTKVGEVLFAREIEGHLITALLTRRYDPSPIWNEAINRAIANKKAAKEDYFELSGAQKAAFERQQETGRKALRNA